MLVFAPPLCVRSGTHPGFLRALDALDQAQQEHVIQVHRLKEERLRNVDEMFVAELQGVEDDYREEAEELREKMMEEVQAKTNERAGPKMDIVTRGKRAKLSTKEERPKKRTTCEFARHALCSVIQTALLWLTHCPLFCLLSPPVKSLKSTLTSDEIASDLEAVRSAILGLGGSTRSKTKL